MKSKSIRVLLEMAADESSFLLTMLVALNLIHIASL